MGLVYPLFSMRTPFEREFWPAFLSGVMAKHV